MTGSDTDNGGVIGDADRPRLDDGGHEAPLPTEDSVENYRSAVRAFVGDLVRQISGEGEMVARGEGSMMKGARDAGGFKEMQEAKINKEAKDIADAARIDWRTSSHDPGASPDSNAHAVIDDLITALQEIRKEA